MNTFKMEYSEPWFFGAFMCYVKVLFYVHVSFRPPMSNSCSVVKNCLATCARLTCPCFLMQLRVVTRGNASSVLADVLYL